VIDTIFELCMY